MHNDHPECRSEAAGTSRRGFLIQLAGGLSVGFFAPLGLVARRRKRYGLLSLALAGTALMMWARVWIGAHHLSDVCAAAGLGWALGWVVLRRGGWNT